MHAGNAVKAIQEVRIARNKIKKISVIAPKADQYHTMATGYALPERGGSGAIRRTHETTPLKASVGLFGKETIIYAPEFGLKHPKSAPART